MFLQNQSVSMFEKKSFDSHFLSLIPEKKQKLTIVTIKIVATKEKVRYDL